MDACINACIHACIHACMDAWMHAWMYTYVYIYIYTYSYMQQCWGGGKASYGDMFFPYNHITHDSCWCHYGFPAIFMGYPPSPNSSHDQHPWIHMVDMRITYKFMGGEGGGGTPMISRVHGDPDDFEWDWMMFFFLLRFLKFVMHFNNFGLISAKVCEICNGFDTVDCLVRCFTNLHGCVLASMHPWRCMHGCMDASCMAMHHAWMHGCMHGCMNGCMHGCMHGCMDACMDAWMDGCRHSCINSCMDACINSCIHAGMLQTWRGHVSDMIWSCFIHVFAM